MHVWYVSKAFVDHFDEIIWILTYIAGQICAKSQLILFQANSTNLDGYSGPYTHHLINQRMANHYSGQKHHKGCSNRAKIGNF